jgi:hypothetical protein
VSPRASKPSIKSLVLQYLEVHRPAEIDEKKLEAIERSVRDGLDRVKPVSRSYLLAILSETPVAITRSLGGLPPDLRGRVHFGSLERAGESLLDLQAEYSRARATAHRERAQDCRRAVRQAKDRLRLMLRKPNLPAEKRGEKEEILRWFLVWLETPELFDRWLALRRREPAAGEPTRSEPQDG